MSQEKIKRNGLKKYSFYFLLISLATFGSLLFLFEKHEDIARFVLFFSVFVFGLSGVLDALNSYKKSEWFYFETVTGKKARIYAILELIAVALIFVIPGLFGLIMNIR